MRGRGIQKSLQIFEEIEGNRAAVRTKTAEGLEPAARVLSRVLLFGKCALFGTSTNQSRKGGRGG